MVLLVTHGAPHHTHPHLLRAVGWWQRLWGRDVTGGGGAAAQHSHGGPRVQGAPPTSTFLRRTMDSAFSWKDPRENGRGRGGFLSPPPIIFFYAGKKRRICVSSSQYLGPELSFAVREVSPLESMGAGEGVGGRFLSRACSHPPEGTSPRATLGKCPARPESLPTPAHTRGASWALLPWGDLERGRRVTLSSGRPPYRHTSPTWMR